MTPEIFEIRIYELSVAIEKCRVEYRIEWYTKTLNLNKRLLKICLLNK
jgi:hypothetical protein